MLSLKTSFGDKLAASNFRPSGFDYLRISLACMVVIGHSATIAMGNGPDRQFLDQWSAVLKLILPAFFCLSGFLVAGSMQRCRTLVLFLSLRGIRIYPALIVEVLLSAFLIGPLVTVIPLGDYFTHPTFLRYLVNVTGHVSYYLPGVFGSNPNPDIVNWQLWTVPWELVCYITISAIILLGVKKNRRMSLYALGFAVVVRLIMQAQTAEGFVVLQTHVWGPDLVLFFLTGIAGFLYKDEIPWNLPIFGMATALAVVAMTYVPGGQYLALVPVVYMTIFIGLCNPRNILPGSLADASYGVYLYGYVLQQLVADLFPWSHTVFLNAAISLPLAILAGLLSWHWIEKPAMKLRTPAKALEERWIAIKAAFAARGKRADASA